MLCKKCGKQIDDSSTFCQYCGKKQITTTKPRKSRKHPNGYGCIVNLGKGRKRPYAVRLTARFIDGVQQYRYVGYYETRAEAEKALAKEQIMPTSEKAKITLAGLYEEWCETPAFTTLSFKTKESYTVAYKHLKPLYKRIFVDLRTKELQCVIDCMINPKTKCPLSKSSKQKVKILLGLLYKYAMEIDLCNKNYAQFIRLDHEIKKEKQIFTDFEIKKLFDNDTIKYVPMILILIYTGLRISEFLSVTKFNVNLKENVMIAGMKTEAGKNRIIPISPKIKKYVEYYYSISTDKMFTRDGETMTANYFRNHIFYNVLDSLEIPRKTPHCCRHTCATLMARAGVDPLAIKQILGHSDYAFTADVYTHPDLKFLCNAISSI